MLLLYCLFVSCFMFYDGEGVDVKDSLSNLAAISPISASLSLVFSSSVSIIKLIASFPFQRATTFLIYNQRKQI